MAVKRLNFTNRSKLTREQANVIVFPGDPAVFELILDLSHLVDSAGAARVFVEAFHRTTRMRFDFGTVAAIQPPQKRFLTEFPEWKDVSFRVKVTNITDAPGRIVAWANNIRPKGPSDDKQDDLVRWKDVDLNGRLWDLEFDEKGPIVLVEKKVGHGTLGMDGRFIAIAYPEILRRSLAQALLVEKTNGDDPDHWFKGWTKGYLTDKLGLSPVPEDADDVEQRRDWIEEAVEKFGKIFKLVDRWQAAQGVQR
jgi:hypothetical protein